MAKMSHITNITQLYVIINFVCNKTTDINVQNTANPNPNPNAHQKTV